MPPNSKTEHGSEATQNCTLGKPSIDPGMSSLFIYNHQSEPCPQAQIQNLYVGLTIPSALGTMAWILRLSGYLYAYACQIHRLQP